VAFASGNYVVVTGIYRNDAGMPTADVLRETGIPAIGWTDRLSGSPGFFIKVGEGCDPTTEALKAFIENFMTIIPHAQQVCLDLDRLATDPQCIPDSDSP
jgi:hypothetical protein